jgi:hypothetical protein
MPIPSRAARRALRVGLLALPLLGMGGFGGGRETGLPARDFRATFVDQDGTRVTATRVTAAGDASLEGEFGRGRLRIPFDNIARIDFQPLEERDRVRAQVKLREGEPATITVRSSATFYGQVPGGAYQIRARDLKVVEFGQ